MGGFMAKGAMYTFWQKLRFLSQFTHGESWPKK